jgi:polyphosphate kinase
MPDRTAAPRLLNRELGTLAFNRRVLAQALDPAIPPLERLRYLCIVASNLDEFFETRVAQLQDLLDHDANCMTPDGMRVAAALELIAADAHELVAEKYRVLQQSIYPLLDAAGIRFVTSGQWTPAQARWARAYFEREVLPVLTPIGLDPAHPFPKVLNKSLNFAVLLDGTDAFGRNVDLGIIQAPRALPRVLALPRELGEKPWSFVLLSSLMQAFAGDLFPGLKVNGVHQFRVTRNSELFVDDDEITNLRTALQGELRSRHYGDAVRLEVAATCPQPLLERLMRENGLRADTCYRVDGPVNLARLQAIIDMIDAPGLTFAPYVPRLPADWPGPGPALFDRIRAADVLLHHPYDAFSPVVDLVRTAARDPDVLAIKQTIYRAGSNSALMEALIEAARNGKEVTVVLELMARLDEETNINWAARLEAEGAHVVYGVVGFKCHAKMLMVVRREKPGRRAAPLLRRYVHVSTGNYHIRTASLYTDFGLMTANEAICADIGKVFTEITGSSQFAPLRELWQSPFSLLENLLKAIRNEAKLARSGKRARIWARVNALVEPTVIEELYRASQAGVEIRLLVRGPCMLLPGVPGMSENIRVRSIIGRFLEHSRVFLFSGGGRAQVWISSADWMERNLFRRVEIATPIHDPKARATVIEEGLKVHWRYPGNAWDMDSSGAWRRAPGWRTRGSSHKALMDSRG